MKNAYLRFIVFVFIAVFGIKPNVYPQSEPVLYVCESYGVNGEVGVSDRFTSGTITVMVKCDNELGLSQVNIQLNKYNNLTEKFEFFKKIPFNVDPTMKYIFFEDENLFFDAPGIYRIFLLNENDKTVTSGLVEIIEEFNYGNKLYFCEDYLQKEEINVSDKFTTGRLTVMVKTKDKLYDEDVALKLEQINDNGTKKYLKTIDFNIPVGDYFFFKHKDLGFSKPGKYRVTLLGKDGTAICFGDVTIVP